MNECSRCGLPPTSNLEKAVKETYSKLWARQKVRNTRGSPRAYLFEKLSLRQGMRILDVGSGSGETVLAIAEKVKPNGKAIGVDFSPDGIAIAREKAKGKNIDKVAEFHLANALKLPFPDNYFDAVISECVICLIPDKQKALNEKVRVLKSGGRVVMHDVISWKSMPKSMKENEQVFCNCVGGAVSIEEYVRMMEKAGLTNIETVDFTKDARKTRASVLEQALGLEDEQEFQEAVIFVRKGGIGYALFSGTKAE